MMHNILTKWYNNAKWNNKENEIKMLHLIVNTNSSKAEESGILIYLNLAIHKTLTLAINKDTAIICKSSGIF